MTFSVPIMRRLADSENPDSFANRLRARRFQQFEALVAGLPRPLRVLDVGGENAFWENVIPLTGDATNLAQFADGSFDVAFSNSVIEHLFTYENQCRMASEMRRVGKAFWVQTPNFWFPMEPHFHVPGWQWMPAELRVSILRRRRCGWRGPCPDETQARELVSELRLLTGGDLRKMFPGASLIPERFCGLVKSWTVIGGFPAQAGDN